MHTRTESVGKNIQEESQDRLVMAGIGKAIKGLGLLAKKYKKGVAKKAAIQTGKRNIESKKLFEKARARSKEKALEMGWKANLKERSRVLKEGQARHKALDIKEGKK